jgi:predicted lipoprotein with Yx(FWY)xxD motif
MGRCKIKRETMKNSTIIWIIVLVVLAVLGIWYWSSTGSGNLDNATSTLGQTTSSSTTVADNTTVVLDAANTSTLGTYLVAPNGMTLYQYANDAVGVSNCAGECATIWPPYTIPASEAETALGSGAGVTGEIGVITRADGTLQLTYNNIPLYFYSKDQSIGDTTGQGVGGTWSVVSPSDVAATPSVGVSATVPIGY